MPKTLSCTLGGLAARRSDEARARARAVGDGTLRVVGLLRGDGDLSPAVAASIPIGLICLTARNWAACLSITERVTLSRWVSRMGMG
jgi:hypothetical protein